MIKENRSSAAPRFLIPQFILSHFSHHVSTGVLVPLLPLLRQGFGLNYFQSGILVSSFSLSYGIGQVPMAYLADRFSRRRIIVIGLLGVSLAGLSVGLTQAFWQMVPCFIAMGLLGGAYHAPASSFISQTLPRDVRGRALGLHGIGGSASFFLTPILALSNPFRILACFLLNFGPSRASGRLDTAAQLSKTGRT